jgi:nitrite reductase/ring-hydroxylating ferredoxin subunit
VERSALDRSPERLCPHPTSPMCMAEGTILRCAWHGWEFDIETGQALADPRVRARTYRVTIEHDDIVVHLP